MMRRSRSAGTYHHNPPALVGRESLGRLWRFSQRESDDARLMQLAMHRRSLFLTPFNQAEIFHRHGPGKRVVLDRRLLRQPWNHFIAAGLRRPA